MPDLDQSQAATVPAQREAVGPVKKSAPVIIALIAIVALIGIANISSLVSGKKKAAPGSALPMRPSTADAQQVSSFQTMQQMQARKDADDRQRQLELASAMQQLQQQQAVPGPETEGTPKMTTAQRSAIYGDSPNAPKQTSNVSQAQAQAKQKALEREKLHQDALNSDTVAVDFGHSTSATAGEGQTQTTAVLGQRQEREPENKVEMAAGSHPKERIPGSSGRPLLRRGQ